MRGIKGLVTETSHLDSNEVLKEKSIIVIEPGLVQFCQSGSLICSHKYDYGQNWKTCSPVTN